MYADVISQTGCIEYGTPERYAKTDLKILHHSGTVIAICHDVME